MRENHFLSHGDYAISSRERVLRDVRRGERVGGKYGFLG